MAEAAVLSIAADGLEGAKLSRIARLAGATTGALTHYFEDKDEVLLAALESVCGRLLDRISGIDERPALEQIADALPLDEESRRDWRVWVAFIGRAAFVPQLARVHQSYYQRIEKLLAEALAGDRTAAAAIIAAVDGIGMRATLEPDHWPKERQVGVLASLLQPILAHHGGLHAHP
jgi:TetR/AcrR family transcriptional repressor of bet genes